MLLQPLVENAIRYGLGDDEKITIQVFEDNIRGLAIITILYSGNGLTLSLIHILLFSVVWLRDLLWEMWQLT